MKECRIGNTGDRIDTIDVLRGFALAGILYAHMIIWYTGAALPFEVYTSYDNIFDRIAMAIFGSLVFGKFFSIFSFLFGLSFYLYFRKNKLRSGYPLVYLWRLFLLFLIGIAHHIIWRGDILAIYAVLGVVLLFFRTLHPKLLLIVALILIINLPTHIYDLLGAEIPVAAIGLPMQAEAENYYMLVQKGDFARVLKENWNSWPAKISYQLESGRLLMTFGFFLLGFYAGRTKLFTQLRRNLTMFRKWNKATESAVLIMLLMGLVMYLNDIVTLPGIKILPEFKWMLGFLFDIYNACLTVFYITGITLLFQSKLFQQLLKPLAPIGRMALTNYLLQTLFGLLLFYDFGIGLFDKTGPAINVIIGIGVFYIQIKFSQWWLSRFAQGPVEWLWRSLTYFKFSPIKTEIPNNRAVTAE